MILANLFGKYGLRTLFALLLSVAVACSTGEVFAQKNTQQTKKTSQTTKKNTAKAKKKTSKTKQKQTSKTKEIKNLQNQQSKINRELKKIDNNLSKTKLTTKQTLREIERLNSDIKKRNAIIAKQNEDLTNLENKILGLNEEILSMELSYKQTKEEYVDLIHHAYVKNNSYSRLMFVLSASSFQETYRRFNYIQQFATLRKKQAEEIDQSKRELLDKREVLKQTQKESRKLLSEREREQSRLINEKDKQNKLVASLQRREKELKKDLAEQQKKAAQLDQKIQSMIAQEAKAEAERKKKQRAKSKQSKKANAASNKKKTGAATTDSDLTARFVKNKGLLMWPVQNGTITGHFGNQTHPVLKHVTTNNKGIYITAPKGSEARCVYQGEVTQRFSIPGNNNAVIVRHGNYLTVYANLTDIYVKVGSKVARGQKIGKIFEDSDNKNKATIFFQIWKEKDLQNPEKWIKRK